MDEHEILQQVRDLVDEEHALRARTAAGELSTDEEQAQLKQLEEALDQAWDLLRQRRARTEFGANPDKSAPRAVSEVEGYLQ
jgi:chromosome condensin MukBEF complex kleisin-like MukF subunit